MKRKKTLYEKCHVWKFFFAYILTIYLNIPQSIRIIYCFNEYLRSKLGKFTVKFQMSKFVRYKMYIKIHATTINYQHWNNKNK